MCRRPNEGGELGLAGSWGFGRLGDLALILDGIASLNL